MPRRRPLRLIVAVLLPALLLLGCDRQSPEPFSVEVRVETQQGEPVQNASVGVRPCYERGGAVLCNANPLFRQGGSALSAKPVELVSWEARRNGNDAVLTWTTASETNNSHFEIERTTDDGSFDQIATVDGQGTTDEATNYRYRDENLQSETDYTYRLRAVDTDGDAQLSETVALRVPKLPRIEPLSPNPFRDRTTLRVEAGTTSTFRSTAHTLDGTQVQTLFEGTIAQGLQQLQWSVQDLSDGVYELRTRLGSEGATPARDTTYAVVVRGPEKATSLGTTGEAGEISTTRRLPFPSLLDVPAIEIRDAAGVQRGTLRVAATVQFVVTTPEGKETFRRSISDERNTFTLSLAP